MIAMKKKLDRRARQLLEELVKERTEDLQRANERLFLATQVKDEFLSHMSKELRTPLNYIIDFATQMCEGTMGALNEEQCKGLASIIESSSRLRAIVDRILELCTIDLGMTRFLPKRFPIEPVLAKIVEDARILAESRGITISSACQEELGPVIADENKVSFILDELLANAVKFSGDGTLVGVSVREVRGVGDGERKYLEVAVTDQGSGIHKDDLERIFVGFERGIPLSTENGGFGLGLALVKRFVDLHGGRIWVESSLGMGSTFTFILPMEGPLPENAPTSRIMMADNDPAFVQMLSHFLHEEGYEVIIAEDGVEVLAKGTAAPPDLFIIALQLPEIDGIDVCLRLKSQAGTKHVPVVIVAPAPAQLEKIKSVQAGVDGFFTKPLDAKELLPKLKSLITQKLNFEFLRRSYEIAAFQASTDPLTGLFNQRQFWIILDRELERARRYGHHFSLAMVDIDNFKEYNDRHGHLKGDEVLRQAAELFRERIRNSDIVARYGGEEFVVVMPETVKELAIRVGDKLCRAFAEYPFPLQDTQPGGRLTISMGVATFPRDASAARDLVDMADRALYRAKKAGKNRVAA
jgi:diguanylate cyclase (GGDEF)-like protein